MSGGKLPMTPSQAVAPEAAPAIQVGRKFIGGEWWVNATFNGRSSLTMERGRAEELRDLLDAELAAIEMVERAKGGDDASES